MANQRYYSRRPGGRSAAQNSPMEKPEPMNRYINSAALVSQSGSECTRPPSFEQNQVLLEQLVEHSLQHNQLLIDLLGAVNALTAAILTTRAQV